MADLRLEHLYKRFGTVEVVTDVTLEVPDGELMVIVGPSGCGKTMLLRMIAGLEEITSGNVYIGQWLVNQVEARDRDIAMVFQNYALYPHMTVFDNMALNLKQRSLPKDVISTRIQEVVDLLEMKPYLYRRPQELSDGQRQRVALGRAIVRDPQVFLLDEPLSGLDAKLRVQTRTELLRIHKRLHRTTIFVTHDQIEAMTLGERIVVMNHGVIQQVGHPQELYQTPANLFVGTFIGSPPMNIFFNVPVVKGDGTLDLMIADQNIPLPVRVANRASPYLNSVLTVGVRAEDLTVVPDHPTAHLHGRVGMVERLGHEQLVHTYVWETLVAAYAPTLLDVKAGDPVAMMMNTSRLHFFDPITTEAIM